MNYTYLFALCFGLTSLIHPEIFLVRTPHFQVPSYPKSHYSKLSVGTGIVAAYCAFALCEGFEDSLARSTGVIATIADSIKSLFSGDYFFIKNIQNIWQKAYESDKWEKKHWFLSHVDTMIRVAFTGAIYVSVERVMRSVRTSQETRMKRLIYATQQQLYALLVMSHLRTPNFDDIFFQSCKKLHAQCAKLSTMDLCKEYRILINAMQKDIEDLQAGYTIDQNQIGMFAMPVWPDSSLPILKLLCLIRAKNLHTGIGQFVIDNPQRSLKAMSDAYHSWHKEYKYNKKCMARNIPQN